MIYLMGDNVEHRPFELGWEKGMEIQSGLMTIKAHYYCNISKGAALRRSARQGHR